MQENEFSGKISMYPSTMQSLSTHVDKLVTSNSKYVSQPHILVYMLNLATCRTCPEAELAPVSPTWSRIENPSLGITVCHHSASLVMPNGDPRDGLFYILIDSYIIFRVAGGQARSFFFDLGSPAKKQKRGKTSVLFDFFKKSLLLGG